MDPDILLAMWAIQRARKQRRKLLLPFCRQSNWAEWWSQTTVLRLNFRINSITPTKFEVFQLFQEPWRRNRQKLRGWDLYGRTRSIASVMATNLRLFTFYIKNPLQIRKTDLNLLKDFLIQLINQNRICMHNVLMVTTFIILIVQHLLDLWRRRWGL